MPRVLENIKVLICPRTEVKSYNFDLLAPLKRKYNIQKPFEGESQKVCSRFSADDYSVNLEAMSI